MNFLKEPWNEKMLHHHDHIENISLSKLEWSTHEIIKPINTESLTSWVGNLPVNEDDIRFIHPLLNSLNYSLKQDDLNYKEDLADELVHANNELIKKNRDYWLIKGKNVSEYLQKLKRAFTK